MSIKPCPECGRIAPADAPACRHCGFRFQTREKPPAGPQFEASTQPASTVWQVISTILLIVFAGAIVLAAVLIAPESKTQRSSAPEKETPAAQPQVTPRPPPHPPEKVADVPQEKPEEPKPPEPAEQPPEPPDTQEEAKKPEEPVRSLEEEKIDKLFAQAKEACRNEQWQAAIDICQKLANELSDEGPAAREINGLLHLARTELLLSRASGTQENILRGLLWLHFHQDKDGKWDQDGFQKNCPDPDAACDGQGISQYDAAVTGLALLAFLGSGHTHRSGGPFRKTVKDGLDWLVGQQQDDGSFGPREAESWIYNTAIGTYALCEAYAVTRDYRLKEPAQKAVDFIRGAQNPGLGWKYESQSGRNDTSVTGWIVMALKAAKTAGLSVDKSMFDGAVNWFDRATNTAGKTGYMRPGDDGSVIKDVNERFAKLPTMTAVAVVCRIFCGQSKRDTKVRRGVDILMSNLPNWNKPANDKVDMYYWYYGTRAMFQYGGQNWRKWHSAASKALVDTQRIGGCADGSWDPVGKWGMVGGRVYSTAMCVLTLQLDYELISQQNKRMERALRDVFLKDREKLRSFFNTPVTIVLKDGNVVRGVVIAIDMDSITLRMGKTIRWQVPRSQIAEITKGP